MSLQLYFHPFASFCQKVLIAFYENDIPFDPRVIDLGDEKSRTEFEAIWPIRKFPVLRDEAARRTIPESSIIIEYLAQYYPGRTSLVPMDAELALLTRTWDRFYDHYVALPMAKIVSDRLRPQGRHDTHGVEESKALLGTAYRVLEQQMENRTWAIGEFFTMADCAAAPALFYADLVLPFDAKHQNVKGYFDRLLERPSFARVVEEAKPYRELFPQ
ncbi:MAG: glutathione S-transferase family protein [Methylocella sp.]